MTETGTDLMQAPRLSAHGSRVPFAILGGGISGLALATFLRARGVEAYLFEKSNRAGGVIGTVSEDGFTFERGPNTVLDKSESLNELIALAGLEGETQRIPLKSQERYIWHAGKLHAVPTGPTDLMSSRLFSLGGKMRIMREPFIHPVQADETLKDFAIRRLGQEAYDRALVPFVQGIGAGDPARMSTEAAFPILKELERSHGSVIKGFIHRAKDRKNDGNQHANLGSNMVTFRGGLEKLPGALASRLNDALTQRAEVLSITPDSFREGFQIEMRESGETRTVHADRLALCGDASSVAGWIENFEPSIALRLRSVHYSPLITVSLGIESRDLKLPPGFGFLAARDHGVRLLGAIFISNFLPDRAPDGCCALTAMLGGDLDPDVMALSDAALIDSLKNDLRKALGWNGEYRAINIERWPRAIPQYGMDYFDLLSEIEASEQRHPGLHYFGNWRGGVSINDRVDQARQMAEKFVNVTAGE